MNTSFKLKSVSLSYEPIEGKTYSLFGYSGSTREYYQSVRNLADRILAIEPSLDFLLETIVNFSSRKACLKKLQVKPVFDSLISACLQLSYETLGRYTRQTEAHLKQLTLKKYWDRRLGTTREQYHLYMLEIELTNRLYACGFADADRKIALLPYCLQDFSVNCKATLNGFDYQCNHCSGKCFENRTGTVLNKYGIEPYIWRGSDFKKLASGMMNGNKRMAVFGIACIPELVWGMRKCRKNGIPVQGLPLNANRCIRWFGEFFPNSVDLIELESMLKLNSTSYRSGSIFLKE
jgi:hypothetical protein